MNTLKNGQSSSTYPHQLSVDIIYWLKQDWQKWVKRKSWKLINKNNKNNDDDDGDGDSDGDDGDDGDGDGDGEVMVMVMMMMMMMVMVVVVVVVMMMMMMMMITIQKTTNETTNDYNWYTFAHSGRVTATAYSDYCEQWNMNTHSWDEQKYKNFSVKKKKKKKTALKLFSRCAVSFHEGNL